MYDPQAALTFKISRIDTELSQVPSHGSFVHGSFVHGSFVHGILQSCALGVQLVYNVSHVYPYPMCILITCCNFVHFLCAAWLNTFPCAFCVEYLVCSARLIFKLRKLGVQILSVCTNSR